MQITACACLLALVSAGDKMLNSSAIIAITTNNSIRVKALLSQEFIISTLTHYGYETLSKSIYNFEAFSHLRVLAQTSLYYNIKILFELQPSKVCITVPKIPIFGTVIGEKGIDDREEKRYYVGAVIRFGFYSKEL